MRTRDCSLGPAGKEGPHLMKGEESRVLFFLFLRGVGESLAAKKGVSSKFLNAFIILSGSLPTGHLKFVWFWKAREFLSLDTWENRTSCYLEIERK